MQKLIFYTLFIPSILISSCSSNNGRTNPNLLPLSVGAPGEMIISMDSSQWKGELGEAIRSIFMAEVPGLPREEFLFTLRYIQPERMNQSLRQVSNLVYITTFNSKTKGSRIIQKHFTPESRKKALSKNNYFLTTAKDLFAKNQSVMYLFGKDEKSLIENLQKHSTQITDHFNRKERERLEEKVFKKTEAGIESSIKKNFGINLKIPYGYQVAMMENDFVWLRQIDREVDKSIIIYFEDYVDFAQFENQQIINRRDKIGKLYLYEDKEAIPDSYLVTETDVPYIPVQSHQVNINGNYAVETRGLWRTTLKTMGGPFLGITVVDESTNRLYYIEGFVFSPGKAQREIIREVNAILNTFETAKKSSKKK